LELHSYDYCIQEWLNNRPQLNGADLNGIPYQQCASPLTEEDAMEKASTEAVVGVTEAVVGGDSSQKFYLEDEA
jgi:hypothetical protein